MTDARRGEGPSAEEGHRLIEAFLRISDPKHRAAVIAAAERLSVQEDPAPVPICVTADRNIRRPVHASAEFNKRGIIAPAQPNC